MLREFPNRSEDDFNNVVRLAILISHLVRVIFYGYGQYFPYYRVQESGF